MNKNVGQLNVKLTADTKPLDQGIDEAINKLDDADNHVQKLDNQSLNTLKESIKSVVNSIKQMGNVSGKVQDQVVTPFERAKEVLGMMTTPIDDFSSELENLKPTELTSMLKDIDEQLKMEVNDMQSYIDKIEQVTGQKIENIELYNPQMYDDFNARLEELLSKRELLTQALESVDSGGLNEVNDTVKNINKNIAKTPAILKTVNTKLNSTFKKGVSSLKRFALGLLGIRTALSYLITSARSYIAYSDELTAKTKGISQALSQSLAPYTEIAVSLLQKLVSWIIKAIAYFTTFINAIFGTKIAVKGLAGSFKDVSKQAKKARDSLAPFDDLNILQTTDTSSDIAPDFSGLGMDSVDTSKLDEFKKKMEDFANSQLWQTLKDHWKEIVGLIALITIAIAAATGSWMILLVAFIAFIALFWDQIKEAVTIALQVIWEIIQALFVAIEAIVLSIVGVVSGILGLILQLIGVIVNTIIDIVKLAINLIISVIKLMVNTVSSLFNTLFSIIKTIVMSIWEIFKTIFTGIKDFIVKIIHGDIKGAFESMKNTVISILGIIWNAVKNIFGKIWGFVASVATGIGETFVGAVRGVVNAIIGFAEKIVNGFIKSINVAISVINAIPGVDIQKLSLINLPKLKTGTVATSPMVAEIAEYSGAKTNPEIVSPRDMMYETMIKALQDSKGTASDEPVDVDITLKVIYEDGRTIIKKINQAQNEAGETLLEV